MHPLAAQIPNGLNSWQAVGAKVGTLKKDKINVPRIWVNSVKNKVFVLIGPKVGYEGAIGLRAQEVERGGTGCRGFFGEGVRGDRVGDQDEGDDK